MTLVAFFVAFLIGSFMTLVFVVWSDIHAQRKLIERQTRYLHIDRG
jgi:hypothetical protein